MQAPQQGDLGEENEMNLTLDTKKRVPRLGQELQTRVLRVPPPAAVLGFLVNHRLQRIVHEPGADHRSKDLLWCLRR